MNIREYIIEGFRTLPDEGADLKETELGQKRAAIISKLRFKSSRTHLPYLESPDPARVIVYGKQYKKIAEAILELLNLPGTAKFKDPNYHKVLGELLDYSPEYIKEFLKELDLQEGFGKGTKELVKTVAKSLHPKLSVLSKGTKLQKRWVRKSLHKVGKAYKAK